MGRYVHSNGWLFKAIFSLYVLESGSDVAKEAGVYSIFRVHCHAHCVQTASIILLKNDFSSIPVAIELGRLVFDNLKKVILYLMPVRNPVFLVAQCALSLW